MKLSVAICTWNRANLLSRTLECLASRRPPAGVEWELLIVDNGCTDSTAAVIGAYRDRLPIRVLYEPHPGLAGARNLAVREATGEYIIWTDDDVLVDASWLEEYCAAFRRHPEAALFGGPIEPWFLEERPSWLVEAWPLVEVAYAVRDLGLEPFALAPGRLPYGANMAFRTDVQKRYLYDPKLGNSGTGRIGGEETRMMREMLAAGASGWWVPGARVKHCIPRGRQTIEYLRSYYTGRGVRLRLDDEHAAGRAKGTVYWTLRRLGGEAAYRVGRLIGTPAWWVRGLRAACIAKGYLGGEAPEAPTHPVTRTALAADRHSRTSPIR
jgi:glycosyltransferase involved in cell wall biosynthesis